MTETKLSNLHTSNTKKKLPSKTQDFGRGPIPLLEITPTSDRTILPFESHRSDVEMG